MSGTGDLAFDSQLERLLRHGFLAIALTSAADGTFVDVNEPYLELFGFARDEIVGRTSLELGIWENQAVRAAIVKDLAREGRLTGRQLRWRTRAGALLESTTTFERFDLAGEAYVLMVICDLSEEGRARDDRDLLFALVPVLLGVAGTDGYFRRVNPAFERVLGFPSQELLARPFIDFVHPDDRAATQAEVAKLAAGATTVAFENRYRCKDGSYRWLSWDSIPVEEEGLIYAAARDVTDQRAATEEARVARAEAERANQAKSEFLSRMSHELRTPLNAILGFAQLLELDGLSDGQGESVRQILKAGRHLLGLINEVLDIARIETGRTSLSIEPVYVSELVADSVGLMTPLAERHGVSLEASAATCEGLVMADRQRTKQVLLNLLSNAIKYNLAGGCVGVACSEAGDGGLRISVSDNGPGIPADKVDRLFTPFDRLGAEASEVEGTGLGLSLARALVEAMGGEIGIESPPGGGTTAWFALPRANEVVLEEAGMVAAAAPMERAGAGVRRVLCIEDNLSSYTLVERVLARLPGVEVVAAMQGGLGLELARELQPSLILLDLNLPDMHGSSVLEALRAGPATQAVPVVILTADATAKERQRLLASGADGYLTKPFDLKEFLELVATQLENEGRNAA